MATNTAHRPLPEPLDLEITIVSTLHQTLQIRQLAKRRSNTYIIFWLDPDVRLATKSDDSNSTKPVWIERFFIPVSSSLVALTLEIFPSKLLDTLNPLVETLRIPIDDLPSPDNSTIIRTFDPRRPSGRTDGFEHVE
ncbi:hypothetical protein R6Q57_025465 [Mikania cordata]